ncbi:MAG: T9SS type A sorting domain-containing protein [Flavobacteriales bacterium]|nr:T9SS type A sorting domain-containing protein [Flavobacteriales bacterium]
MKKFYLTVLSLAVVGGSAFSQSKMTTSGLATNVKNNSLTRLNDERPQTDMDRASHAIWEDDFSTPANWVIANEAANADDWVIGTAGPAGPLPIPAITSTSGGNFALFDSDNYCSGDEVANLTTASSIDLSGFSAVVLEFEQFYRRFNDSTFVLVSTDGTNWVKYAVNESFGTNDQTGDNPDLVAVNISATAANEAQVWIRFQFWSPSTYTGPGNGGPGCAYAWMIDDVAIVEGAANDLVLGDIYHGDPILNWEYAITPVAQVVNVYLGAFVTNFGSANETNVSCTYDITRDGNSVNSGSFTIGNGSIAGGAVDTGWYDTGFMPTEVGTYVVTYTITSDAADENPGNNTGTRSFQTSQYEWSHEMESLWDGQYGGYIVPNSNPQELEAYSHGSVFCAVQDAELYGLNVSFGAATSATTSIPLDLTIVVNEIGASIQDIAAELAFQDVTITGSGWSSFMFDSPVSLEAGKGYILAVSTFGGEDIMTINGWGVDADFAAANYGPFGQGGAENWYNGWDFSSAIRANFDPALGIGEFSTLPGISIYPNPTEGVIRIDMEVQDTYTIEIMNVLGELVESTTVSANTYVDLNRFGTGLYLVRVSTETATYTERVIVQ